MGKHARPFHRSQATGRGKKQRSIGLGHGEMTLPLHGHITSRPSTVYWLHAYDDQNTMEMTREWGRGGDK